MGKKQRFLAILTDRKKSQVSMKHKPLQTLHPKSDFTRHEEIRSPYCIYVTFPISTETCEI